MITIIEYYHSTAVAACVALHNTFVEIIQHTIRVEQYCVHDKIRPPRAAVANQTTWLNTPISLLILWNTRATGGMAEANQI